MEYRQSHFYYQERQRNEQNNKRKTQMCSYYNLKNYPHIKQGKSFKLKELSRMSHYLYVLCGIVAYIEDQLEYLIRINIVLKHHHCSA